MPIEHPQSSSTENPKNEQDQSLPLRRNVSTEVLKQTTSNSLTELLQVTDNPVAQTLTAIALGRPVPLVSKNKLLAVHNLGIGLRVLDFGMEQLSLEEKAYYLYQLGMRDFPHMDIVNNIFPNDGIPYNALELTRKQEQRFSRFKRTVDRVKSLANHYPNLLLPNSSTISPSDLYTLDAISENVKSKNFQTIESLAAQMPPDLIGQTHPVTEYQFDTILRRLKRNGFLATDFDYYQERRKYIITEVKSHMKKNSENGQWTYVLDQLPHELAERLGVQVNFISEIIHEIAGDTRISLPNWREIGPTPEIDELLTAIYSTVHHLDNTEDLQRWKLQQITYEDLFDELMQLTGDSRPNWLPATNAQLSSKTRTALITNIRNYISKYQGRPNSIPVQSATILKQTQVAILKEFCVKEDMTWEEGKEALMGNTSFFNQALEQLNLPQNAQTRYRLRKLIEQLEENGDNKTESIS